MVLATVKKGKPELRKKGKFAKKKEARGPPFFSHFLNLDFNSSFFVPV
jgi:hypothetical protein